MEEIFKRREMLRAMQAAALAIGDLDRFDELAPMLADVDDLLSYVTSPDPTHKTRFPVPPDEKCTKGLFNSTNRL